MAIHECLSTLFVKGMPSSLGRKSIVVSDKRFTVAITGPTLSQCLFFSISEFLIYCRDWINRKRPFQSINLAMWTFSTLSTVAALYWDPTNFTLNNVMKPVRTPVAILGSVGVCIYVPASRHWLISYSPIHLI